MSIPVALLVLAVLIFVHELGHFLLAKFFRVGVLEFAIGFGPKLLSFVWGETTYTLRAIPLGGFVRMVGDDPRLLLGELDDQGDATLKKAVAEGERGTNDSEVAGGSSPIEGVQEELTEQQKALLKDESRWFLKQGYIAKCAIVFAGPLFNFLFAWVLAAGLLFFVGAPERVAVEGPVIVGSITPGMPADNAGLKTGDTIKTVDGRPIANYSELVNVVRSSAGKSLSFVIERKAAAGGVTQEGTAGAATQPEILTIGVTPTSEEKQFDVLENQDTKQATYRIGVAPYLGVANFKPLPLFESIQGGALYVYGLTETTLKLFKALLTGVISPTKSIGGPISIIKQTAESAQEGLSAVIGIMILLNVSLAVLNLMPVPVLDGGHLTIFTIELIKGSALSMRVRDMATKVGFFLLLVLMGFAVRNDLFITVPSLFK